MKLRQFVILLGILFLFPQTLSALSAPSPSPTPIVVAKVSMKTSSNPHAQQEPGKVDISLLEKASSEPISILISLSKQRAYLLIDGKIAIDSPISSGKKNGWTHKGEFLILEKDPNHQSSLYGDFVDGEGKIVRSGISRKLDTPPSGTHYRGASMKFFMRLTPEGIGMHEGILPGYPASHGCIRLPKEMAKLIYSTVTLYTPVSVTD